MKLKTLKDIKGIYSNGNNQLGSLHYNVDELKKEGIKQFKYFRECYDKTDSKVLKTWYNGKLTYIYNLFNLTDEDVK